MANSTYHPHGLDIVDGPIGMGSAIMYFDGLFPQFLRGNIQGPMEYHSLAHNQVLGFDPAVDLATDYLLNGTIIDNCNGLCYFEGTW